MIASFEDEPYTGAFTGNVTELCPVGALLPTQPRFEIRPWEFQAVPSVCGLCPVGCNIDVDQREGKIKRILSRNHPEVDEGDRKSTRLNSSHSQISYAVFCLKKKTTTTRTHF